MRKQVEHGVQNGPERCFAGNYFIFLKNFISIWEPLTKSWSVVPTTHMSIFIFFVSAGVLFEGVFFPVLLSLTQTDLVHLSSIYTLSTSNAVFCIF